MKIGEYLLKKYGRKSRFALSKAEANVFNIPFPLEKGWVARYENVEIWPEQMEKIAVSFSNETVRRKKKGKEPKRYHSVATELARQYSGPVTIIQVQQAPAPAPVKNKTPRLPYVDPNSPDFLSSYSWRALRMQALKTYGAVCMCCGDNPKNGAVMNVDHIKPRKTNPELALRLDNLQILCGACNHGKGNWDETDWRESDPASQEGLDDYSLQSISSILSKLR